MKKQEVQYGEEHEVNVVITVQPEDGKSMSDSPTYYYSVDQQPTAEQQRVWGAVAGNIYNKGVKDGKHSGFIGGLAVAGALVVVAKSVKGFFDKRKKLKEEQNTQA